MRYRDVALTMIVFILFVILLQLRTNDSTPTSRSLSEQPLASVQIDTSWQVVDRSPLVWGVPDLPSIKLERYKLIRAFRSSRGRDMVEWGWEIQFDRPSLSTIPKSRKLLYELLDKDSFLIRSTGGAYVPRPGPAARGKGTLELSEALRIADSGWSVLDQ